MKFKSTIFTLITAVCTLGITGGNAAFAEDPTDRFSDMEIRVIRPKYFTKRKRFELGFDAAILTNQTFIYTYLLSLNGTFHITETISLEGSGYYGLSVEKADKTSLAEFPVGIKTNILNTKYLADGSLLWTPIYGKYQLQSGRLIYFDTFLIGGLGITGAEYKYEHCTAASEAFESGSKSIPSPQTKSYTTFLTGGGQRYFINKSTSFKWSIRYQRFSYPLADGSCDPTNPDSGAGVQQNIFLQLGASKFF